MLRNFILPLALLLCVSLVKDTGAGPPPEKKLKPSCYFASEKKALGETGDRPLNSRSSTTCKGELTELSSLASGEGLHGAPHELALILARYEGRFLNSTDPVTEWAGSHICAHHLDELSRQWSQGIHRHIQWKKGKTTCGHYDHANHPVQSKHAYSLTYDQSERILNEKGVVMHPGIPLCQRHHDALTVKPDHVIHAVKDEEVSGDFDDVCYDKDSEDVKDLIDTIYKSSERTKKYQTPLQSYFQQFAKEAGASRFRCRKSFHELSYSGQYSKVRVALLLQNVTVEQLAGESREAQAQLSALIRRMRDGKPTSNEDHETLTAVLDDVAKEFRMARTTQERVMIISLFARRIPYRVLSKYVDGLSERLFNQAKKKAIDAKSYLPPDHTKERYDPIKLSHFISFITSGHVMIGLPWGESRTKDSKGNVVYLPNYVRMTGIYETINLYESYMRETGRESLIYSNSTTYRILKSLPAMKTTSLTCVDYFQASGTNASLFLQLSHALRSEKNRAFIAIDQMLGELDTLALIDSSDVKYLKAAFEDMKIYLKGNFRLHLKSQSVYSDHCLSWSLSDPKDPRLSSHPNDHVHTNRCPECLKMDETITGVKKMLAQLAKDTKEPVKIKKIKEFIHEFDQNVERIYDLKAHHVRTVMTGKERENKIENLKENQAFITLDYAQRFLPSFYRETQKLYFGKAGLSWHISHVLSNQTGKHGQHSFIHLLKNDQNSTVVVEVIRHLLKELHTMGIKEVHLRSDNAGYYHCNAVISSVSAIANATGVKILSWSYSESQSGKSSSDRIAALVKRKMRDWVAKRNNINTVEDMFTAITQGKQLKGVSVHLGTVIQKKLSPSKIDRVSELGTFSFVGDKVRGWRFYGVGDGVDLGKLVPVQATFEITQNGGKTASEEVRKSDQAKIALGQEPSFWYVPPEKTYDQMHEVNDVDDDVASDQVHQNPVAAHEESIYYCPVCGASFIKYSNLVRHIDSGKHRIRPDRVSLLDYALGLFKSYLEDIKQAVSLIPLSDSIRALQSGNDKELPKGWALRMTRKGGRYPEKSKEFVRKHFEKANSQGRKLRAEEVELLLKGEDSIEPHERMNLDQIRNCIRTMAAALEGTKRTRGTRSIPLPIYTDEDGFIEEEVDVPEEDHRYTDDDLFTHVIGNIDYYFEDVNNPVDSNDDTGNDFE